MKKTLTIIFTALSFMIILDTFNAGHAFVMFFLAGVIPGTNISIAANQMLATFAFLMGFTLSRVSIALYRLYIQGKNETQSSNGTMLSAQS